MKKLFVTILAVCYFALSWGATVHFQYCMGKLVKVSLISDDSDDCEHCGMKKDKCSKKCCKEISKTIKSTDQKQQSSSFYNFTVRNFDYLPVYPFPQTNSFALLQTPSIGSTFLANSPPSLWRSCPIYIQVCNFRI